MQRLRGLLIVMGWLACAAAASADVELKWKLKAGDTFFAEEKTETKMEINTMGQNMPMEMTNVTKSQYTVKEVKADGGIVIERVIQDITNEMSGPMAGMDTDAMSKAMQGLKFTITFDKDWKITQFKGYDELLDRMRSEDEMSATMLKQMMPEETFRKSVEELFGMVPQQSVKIGDTWDRKTSMSLGPLGKLTVDVQYKLDKADGDHAHIGYTMKMKHDPSKKNDEDSAIPFNITKMDVQTSKCKGEVVFNRERGRLDRTTTEMNMTIKMTGEVQGQEIEMEIHQEIKSSMKVHDKSPSK